MIQRSFRRWLPWVAFVLVFTTGTSLLSWWQFERREQRVQQIEQVLENYSLATVSLDDLLLGGSWSDSLEWRAVSLEGEYLVDQLHLVRNRPLAGRPGFLVLVPFRLTDGRVIAVERGWLPTGSLQDSPDSIPAILSPNKTLEVRLRAAEPDLNREPVPGQLASIDLTEFSNRTGLSQMETAYYGRVISEFPVEPDAPSAMPAPSLSEGNHLSYALQWILFGLMAIAALVWAIRNEKLQRDELAGIGAPRVKRKGRAEMDAEAEDALVTQHQAKTG